MYRANHPKTAQHLAENSLWNNLAGAHPTLHACMASPHFFEEEEATAAVASCPPCHHVGPPGMPFQPSSDSDPRHVSDGPQAGTKASSHPGDSPEPEPVSNLGPPRTRDTELHTGHTELHRTHCKTGQCAGVVESDASMRSAGAAGASPIAWPGLFRDLLHLLQTQRQVTRGIVTPADVRLDQIAAGAAGMRAVAHGLRVSAGHGSGADHPRELTSAEAGGSGARCGGSDDELCFSVPPAVTPAWRFLGEDFGEGGDRTAEPPQEAGPELGLIGQGVPCSGIKGRLGKSPSGEGLQTQVFANQGRSQARPAGPHSEVDEMVEASATGALGVAPPNESVQGGGELDAAAAMAAAVAGTLPPFKFFLTHDQEIHDAYVMLEGCESDGSAVVTECG